MKLSILILACVLAGCGRKHEAKIVRCGDTGTFVNEELTTCAEALQGVKAGEPFSVFTDNHCFDHIKEIPCEAVFQSPDGRKFAVYQHLHCDDGSPPGTLKMQPGTYPADLKSTQVVWFCTDAGTWNEFTLPTGGTLAEPTRREK